MSWLLAGISAAFMTGQKIKEMRAPVIPASYWRNQEIMRSDQLNPNISPQQVQKNLENGKYYLSDEEYTRRNKKPDYSYREGENINSWMERLSREQKERTDKLYGRK